MKKIFSSIAIAVVLFLAGAGLERVRAQAVTSATPYTFSSTGLLANCPVVATGANQWCFTTTGVYQSLNGSTWALLGATGPQGPAGPTGATGATGPAGPAGSGSGNLTINGTTKALPGPFTITASAATVTAQ